MPLSGQAMSKGVMTIGAGILLGIIAPMAGILVGTIPGTIPLGMVAGTILGIMAIMAGVIHIATMVITGLTPSIMVAATYTIHHAIVLHASRLEQVVTALVQVVARQQDVDPSVAAMAIVEAARQLPECQVVVAAEAPLVAAVLPAVLAPLVEVAALVVAPLEAVVAEAALEVVADSDAIDRV